MITQAASQQFQSAIVNNHAEHPDVRKPRPIEMRQMVFQLGTFLSGIVYSIGINLLFQISIMFYIEEGEGGYSGIDFLIP